MFNKEYMHWTDMYKVVYPVGIIKMYISSYKDGSFLGTVMYDKSLVNGGNYQQWSLKHFPEQTEKEAYEKCDNFVNDLLEGKGEYTITKISRTP